MRPSPAARTGKKFAVFDIDGTIFRSSLLIELVEELISDGVFPKSARGVYERAHKAWLDREGTYPEYIAAVVRAFDRHLKGVREEDLKKAVRKVAAFHKHRVYRYTRDLVRELRRKGYYLLAISQSPKYVVDAFGGSLGFDKIYGRILELDAAQRFTGKAHYVDLIDDKEKVLRRAVEKENLSLKDSIGVGDTGVDIGFLKLVRRPICFNPNRDLFDAARKHKWTVVVERKDVIYTIR
jgi:HAD superfamily phosphoserine phosphatase-like hydrolase